MLGASIIALALRAIGVASSLGLSVIVTRTLPVEDAGVFFLALTVITFLANCGMMGLNNSILRFVGGAYAENGWREIAAVMKLVARWAGACLVGVSLFVAVLLGPSLGVFFNRESLSDQLFILAPAILGLGGGYLIGYFFQAVRKTEWSALFLSIIVPFCSCLILSVATPVTLERVSLVYTSTASVSLLCGIFWVVKCIGLENFNSSRFDARVLWGSCSQMWVVTIMNQIVLLGGQFFSGMILPPEEFALLAVAQKVSGTIAILLVAANLVVAPNFASLYRLNRIDDLEKVAQRAVMGLLLLVSPVMILISLKAKLIMSVFGDSYSDGFGLLLILACGQFLNAATGPVGHLLATGGYERDVRKVNVFAGLSVVILSPIIAVFWGAMGVALISALVLSFQNFALVFAANSRLGFNPVAVWKLFRR